MTAPALNGVPPTEPLQAGGHSAHAGTPPASSNFAAVLQARLQNYPTSASTMAAGGLQAIRPHSMPNASVRVGHIPLRQVPAADADEHIHERALKIRWYRMELLASNIANADTPGYKARDIDVAEALHMRVETPSEIPIKYVAPSQISADGNTVEMDVERAKFAENALMYQFSLQQVMGHYRDMLELFKNLKD